VIPPVIRQASNLLRRSGYTVALTGAGISTPSGIPDFRTPAAGLWSQFDPLEVASIWAFAEHPERFYRWIRPLLRRLMTAQPNAAHHVLAEMESRGALRAVITQNVDSLHQAAGSRRVLELHGHTRAATCIDCGFEQPTAPMLPALLSGALPRCPRCGGWLKPNVILYGELLPYDVLRAAQQEALACEVMLIVGSSLEVLPAADLPLLARRRGARLILINQTSTPLDDQAEVLIHDDVARALPQVWHDLAD